MDHVDFDRLLLLDARDRMEWLVEEIENHFPPATRAWPSVGTNHLRIVGMALEQVDRAGAVDHPKLQRLAREARARVEQRFPWIKEHSRTKA